MSEQSKLIEFTGLWVNESRNGEKYFSGNVSGRMKLLIFKSKHKETDKHPDYIAYLAPVEKKPDAGGSQTSGTTTQPPDDDLPF